MSSSPFQPSLRREWSPLLSPMGSTKAKRAKQDHEYQSLAASEMIPQRALGQSFSNSKATYDPSKTQEIGFPNNPDFKTKFASLKEYQDYFATKHLPLGEEANNFADCLLKNKDNPSAILEGYVNICKERMETLQDSPQYQDFSEYSLWENEYNTWILVFNLYHIRLSKTEDHEAFSQIKNLMSDSKILDICTQADLSLQEDIIVKKWLESTAKSFNPSEVQSHYWENTKRLIENAKKTGKGSPMGIVTQLDPDAPFREGRRLEETDQEFEGLFFQTLFNYLRRGMFEAAIHYCCECGQQWRAASLWGFFRTSDPFFDEGIVNEPPLGNKNRGLWKKTCLALAEEPTANEYERAIYSFLAGKYQQVLPVCRSWEDLVWAYYNTMIEEKYEEYLERFTGVAAQKPKENLQPREIFERVIGTSEGYVADNFHSIQADLILGNINGMLVKQDSNLQETRSQYQLTRFMTHLILFLRNFGEHSGNPALEDSITQRYAEMLFDCKKGDLLAIYISKLSEDVQIETYSSLFQKIREPLEIKRRYYEDIRKYEMDYPSIAKETSRKALWEVSQQLKRMEEERQLGNDVFLEFNSLVGEEDERLIGALEWLIFEEELIPELMGGVNDLVRWFLSQRKLKAAKKVNELFKEFLPAEADLSLLTHLLLVTALDNFVEWAELHIRISASATKVDEFLAKTSFLQKVLNDLLFVGGLKDPILARMYVPDLVFKLHTLLFKSKDLIHGHLEKSLALAEDVADEKLKIYQEFDPSQMAFLLQKFRQSRVELLKRDS